MSTAAVPPPQAMSVPPTRIVMLDFPPCELPEFMEAVSSALPGSVWHAVVIHEASCPLSDLKAPSMAAEVAAAGVCTCDVAQVVMITRLPAFHGEGPWPIT